MTKKKIAIFGLSYDGRAIYRKHKTDKKYEIIAFIDSYKDVCSYNDITVLKPEKILEIEFDNILIAGRYAGEQKKQLERLGIPSSKILHLSKKDLLPPQEVLDLREQNYHKELEFLYEISRSFKGIKNYFIDFSALLAFKRNKQFSIFSDLDIGILDSQFLEFLIFNYNNHRSDICLEEKLIQTDKYYLPKGSLVGIQLTLQGIDEDQNICLDFQLRPLINDSYKSLVGKLIYSTPKKYYANPDNVIFKGLQLKIPSYSDEYIKMLYGKNWVKPDKFWTPESTILLEQIID